MSDYKEVLNRLAAYRKRLGMTQEQIADKINITQEQYSYLENGIMKITDKDMKVLTGLGWNIDYIITGTESYSIGTELEEVFNGFRDAEGREFAMKICAAVMIEKAVRGGLAERSSRMREDLALLEDMVESWQHFSMCYHVRKRLQLSQIAMADRLGVGVRKYRELERENRYPDAEILLHFYDMSGYRPMLFLDFYDRRMLLIKQIWNVFDGQEKEEIVGFIDYVKRML